MSNYTDNLRARLDAETNLAKAKFYIRLLIRMAAMRTIYRYAELRFIVDFSDTELVEQKHRDYYNNVKSNAATAFSNVAAATTKAELISVFDQIEPWLER